MPLPRKKESSTRRRVDLYSLYIIHSSLSTTYNINHYEISTTSHSAGNTKFFFFFFLVEPISPPPLSSSNRLYFDSIGKSSIDLYHSHPLNASFLLYSVNSPFLSKMTSVSSFLFLMPSFRRTLKIGSILNLWAGYLQIGHNHFGI